MRTQGSGWSRQELWEGEESMLEPVLYPPIHPPIYPSASPPSLQLSIRNSLLIGQGTQLRCLCVE